jgi:N-acetylmuramoyl-L-alanine amidase
MPNRFPPFSPDSSVVERVVPSPNFEDRANLRRPDMIVLHYTGMETGDAALERLCDRDAKVSSHYLVYENGSTVQMVPEALRAFHAGVSSWEGETDTNSRSIGIEIVNPGHDFGYPPFPSRQIAAVIMLCKGILTRHAIRRENIVAHSDVAPARKQDPGEKFPWKLLYESGVGLWVEPAPITDWLSLIPGDSGDIVRELQQSLSSYGYGIEVTGEYNEATKIVVTAFQRHFRPAQIDGMADTSTRDTLARLLKAKANPPHSKETKNSLRTKS